MKQLVQGTGKSSRARSGAPWAGALVATSMMTLGLAVVVVGCDAGTRYRVLSFFFDGVPNPDAPPDQPETITGPWGIRLDPNDPRAKDFASRPTATRPAGGPAAPPPAFLHAPYKQRQCLACHASAVSFEIHDETVSCRKCHEAPFERKWDDWTHGPVAVGNCSTCHPPHQARYRGLLAMPTPELCLSCHDASRVLAQAYHAGAADTPCTQCHDPHMAGNRLLLVDSGSYERRRGHEKYLPSKHAQWGKGLCATCHIPEKSNQLLDNIDAVCVTCHEAVRQRVAGRSLHRPVRQGLCTTCHVAHKSPLPHQIKPAAEKNCLGCHDVADYQSPAHPPVRRADCLLCHAGHWAPGKHLLKANGPFGRRWAPLTSGAAPPRDPVAGGRP